ncbi:MAG: type II secretion system F family protein [Chloroflexota bacterium]
MNPVTILVIGGGLALVLLIIGIVVSVTSQRSLVEERLGHYLETEAEIAALKEEKRSFVTDWLDAQMERSTWGEKISRELSRADLKLRPGEYLALIIICSLGVGIVSWFFFGRSIWFALGGCALGAFIPRLYVGWQQSQRVSRFNGQLADMLSLVVNGLRAGYSTMQAMEAVSRELPSPIADEFRRVVQEMQLGIPMEEALDHLLRRIPSDDLDFVITAINVQREVGGNLAEILETIAFTIRERVRIQGEIRVLTTQVLYSGRGLALIPIGLTLFLFGFNRDYLLKMFDVPVCGYSAMGTATLMIVLGYYIMNRIAKIEV